MTYLILALATWRISSLLVGERGPGDIFEKMRRWLGVYYDADNQGHGSNMVAEAFTCVWCLSIWVGVIITVSFLLIPNITTWLAMPLALSAAAIVVDKVANHG